MSMIRNSSANEAFTPASMPEGFNEPSDGTLRYTPHGAMPANPYFDDQLIRRQTEIDAEFQKLFDTPPEGTPKRFAHMLRDDHMIHEVRRKMLNFEGFLEWQATDAVVPVELQEILDAVIHGTASVEEIFEFALHTGINAFEIGKVTHPYRRRLEHVEPFRSKVDAAILTNGGEVYGKDFPYRSIDIRPDVTYKNNAIQINGFIVPYKRDVGDIPLPDGTGVIHVVERQLAAFRTDELSGFNQNIIKMMKYGSFQWKTAYIDAAYQDALKNTGCRGYIERSVQLDSLEDFVVPVSTTIYGYKELYKPTTETLAQRALRAIDLTSYRPE